jgi:hypothetical protein
MKTKRFGVKKVFLRGAIRSVCSKRSQVIEKMLVLLTREILCKRRTAWVWNILRQFDVVLGEA